jgi:WD40 repeat protein
LQDYQKPTKLVMKFRATQPLTGDGLLDFTPDGTRLLSTGVSGNVAEKSQPLPIPLPKLADKKAEKSLADAIYIPESPPEIAQQFAGVIKVWDVADLIARPRVFPNIWGQNWLFAPLEAVAHVMEVEILETTAKIVPQLWVHNWAFTQDGRGMVVASGLESFGQTLHHMGQARPSGPHAVWAYSLSALSHRPLVLRGDETDVCAVAVSPSGNTIATGNLAGKVRFWESDPERASQIIARFNRPTTSIALLGSGKKMIACDDIDLEVVSAQFPYHHISRIRAWADGTFLKLDGSKPVTFTERLLGIGSSVHSVATCFSDSSFVSGNWDGGIVAWSLDSGTYKVLARSLNSVNSISLSRSGKLLAAVVDGDDTAVGEILLWRNGLSEKSERIAGRWRAVALCPDGTRLAAQDPSGKVTTWDLENVPFAEGVLPLPQHLALDSGPPSLTAALSFSRNGTELAASIGSEVVLWDRLGDAKPRVLIGHTDRVTGLCFSPDGSALATASRDCTVRYWPLKRHIEGNLILHTHTRPVRMVTFSTDGERVFSAGEDGTIMASIASTEQVAALVARRLRRNLTQAEWDEYIGPDFTYEKTVPDLVPEQP